MTDKTQRKATAEQHGSVVIIRMTGGLDCLWLRMYLDTEAWQMTCDSDIGSYAYSWGKPASGAETFTEFCCRWLYDDEWLLRKCIGERHEAKAFDVDASVTALREAFLEYNGEDADTSDLEEVLDEARAYSDNADMWCVAVSILADEWSIEMPDEWYQCIEKDYTQWQKRFAKICREVIAPALHRFIKQTTMVETSTVCPINGAPCCECVPGAHCAKMGGGDKEATT